VSVAVLDRVEVAQDVIELIAELHLVRIVILRTDEVRGG
jgi:hypothetical protein